MATFHIRLNQGGEYYFTLEAADGDVILTSEGYTSKQSCKSGIKSVRANAPNDKRYDRKTSKSSNASFYFNLRAANFKVIGTSDRYPSEPLREDGIDEVKHGAPRANVMDHT
jgi:uncharacterized protein YegP (UPF0339 family)